MSRKIGTFGGFIDLEEMDRKLRGDFTEKEIEEQRIAAAKRSVEYEIERLRGKAAYEKVEAILTKQELSDLVWYIR